MLLHKMRENVKFSLAEAGHRMNMLTVFHASHSELNLTRNLIKKVPNSPLSKSNKKNRPAPRFKVFLS